MSNFGRGKNRAMTSIIRTIFVFALLGLILGMPQGAIAQPATEKPAGSNVPADIQRGVEQIADLDLLKALLPLKLTAEQRDKLVAGLKAASASNEARLKADHEAWRKVLPAIEKAHADALMGTPMPPEVEASILKLLSDSEKRINSSKKELVNRIFVVAKEVLTPTQIDEVERQTSKMLGGKRLVPREYKNNPSQAPKEVVQDLMLQMYVERIFLFERTLTVLSRLQLASES